MRGRKKGATTGVKLPSSYEVGDGYVNLCLAVLRQAKANEGTEYQDEMWSQFTQTRTYKMGREKVDPFKLACGIASYLGS